MFSDDIGLYLDPRTGLQVPQVRMPQRVLYQRHLQAAWLEIIDGETHAVDGDRPVKDKKWLESGRNRDVDELRVTFAAD